MADILSKKRRSEVMGLIRAQGNKKTELALIDIFRARKITGWRRHLRIFGRPDFAFPTRRVVVFVDGCFWHQCKKHSKVPKTNRLFWKKKLAANRRRDRLVSRTLRNQGWHVLRLWEHELAPTNRQLLDQKLKCLFQDKVR